MTTPTTVTPSLDNLLAPFEARRVALARDEIAERRRSLALGDELNRIQGQGRHGVVDRLGRLWCNGQITHAEYFALLGDVGRHGYLNGHESEDRG